MDSATARERNQESVRRYRAKHRRIDYAPSAQALAVIEQWRAARLDTCLAGVIDRLILAGHNGISGSDRR